jgi:tetratricopeptide (TPR) repeat protein
MACPRLLTALILATAFPVDGALAQMPPAIAAPGEAATCVDPTFADAWYNLSDLLDEQGRIEAAIECLRTALRVAPDYADATFNLALLLQRTNQYAAAIDYWRRYLVSDRQSEWAARARRSLKFCEMQINLIASA